MTKISDLMREEEEKQAARGNFKPYYKCLFSFPAMEQDKRSKKFVARARLRFLLDFEDGFSLHWHKNTPDKSFSTPDSPFERGVDFPCWKEFDLDCPYCQSGDKKTRRNSRTYIWPVWDYEREEIVLFSFRNNEKTMTGDLWAYASERPEGAILQRDFIARKTADSLKATSSNFPVSKLTAEDPSDFQFLKKVKVPSPEIMRTSIVLAKDPVLSAELNLGPDDCFMQFEDLVPDEEPEEEPAKPVKQIAAKKTKAKPAATLSEADEIDAFQD